MTENTGLETVLIVDDEKTFLLSLKDGLKVHQEKFRVLTAESGKEAIAILRALPVDLLVTDLKMPEVDGFELLAWATREKPELPVIVMTAFGTAQIEEQLAGIESLQYLEKPLEIADLESAIFASLKAKARSYIRGITLSTFLQLMQMEKKTCSLKVTQEDRVGYLYLKAGVLLDAECGELHGEAAACEVVAWEDAEIEMDSVCRRQKPVINTGLEHLLIDAFRRKDEQVHQEKGAAAVAASEERPEAEGAPDSELFPGEVDPPEASPEAEARKKLVEVLTRHPGVQEFALFDPNGFLEDHNEGKCSLMEFDPALFLLQVDSLDEVLSFGSFSHMGITTASRHHCLLFRIQQHRVVLRLARGQRTAEVMKQVKQYLRR